MNALEQYALDNAPELAFGAGNDVQVLGTDYHIHRLILVKAEVHTVKDLVLEHDLVVLEHDAVNDVALADEVGHILVDGFVVDVGGGADLLDLALLHNDDLVRHGQGLFLVVGYKDEGDAHFLLDALELMLHLLTQLVVQGAQRFVQQQDARLIDQRTGNGDTLLLTAAHLGDIAVGIVLQVHQLEHTHYLLLDDVLGFLLDLQAEGNVVVYIHVGEQGVFLEYGVDLPLVGRYFADILSIEEHMAFGGFQEAAENTQKGGFAAAAGAQQGDKLIFIDIQADTLEYQLSVKFLDDVLEFDQLLFHTERGSFLFPQSG